MDSLESSEQIKREQSVQRIIYQRESEIPKSPMESISQKSFSLKDIITIPFFKAGSFPPKTIKIVDQLISMNDDFMKNYQPPPPPLMQNPYPQVHALMPHPAMYQQMNPPPQMISRAGPLPSVPLPAPPLPNSVPPSFNPYSMNPHAIYDPSMMGGQNMMGGGQNMMGNGQNMMSAPMDPYGMMNKTRMLYNPITKKPQNYRTVPCRRFHSADGCDRGDNCHFIHDFQHQGRPIPNSHDWKNNNMMKRNMQPQNSYNPAMPSYYPPPGPDIHNNRTY